MICDHCGHAIKPDEFRAVKTLVEGNIVRTFHRDCARLYMRSTQLDEFV